MVGFPEEVKMKTRKAKDGGIPYSWYYEVTREEAEPPKVVLVRRNRRGRIYNFIIYCVVVSAHKFLKRIK